MMTGEDRYQPPFGPELPAAVAFAEQRHDGQRRRYDRAPFIHHPLEVATLLRDAGAGDELVAAGVLHDVVEKASVSPGELEDRFGPRVAGLVCAVSENPAIAEYAARKAALREQVAYAGEDALMLFAADKLSKVRELHDPRAKAPARRITHYRRSLELLKALLPDYRLTRELDSELEQVLALRALAVG
jgi:(p)ppGpp synthase/HD superfamily hydrolase